MPIAPAFVALECGRPILPTKAPRPRGRSAKLGVSAGDGPAAAEGRTDAIVGRCQRFLEALLKSPLAVLLVALVGASACTDAISTAPSEFKARAATTTSTAPPPPVTGVISGSFAVAVSGDAAVSSSLSSLSLDVTTSATPLHHTFSQAAIYNKDLLTGISSIQMRNHLAIWVSDAGASIGQRSTIAARDQPAW